ncbi:TetR/AcrR family transcriptional regulator [Labrys sp. LIt4]|uniref:TetR family transcriptional regulator n=1 Tax=Labrys okinawensis TaxID=346911 RepID=A0A2S9QGB8_9HYPH|nr:MULTISPECIES: TetR/AcrR family transcriptional regulator [Labrys]MBP0579824.1 TetR/AcrR family transcriptional regulator [Labrys sp. LIt4]PRH88375.1 TetR family transcriptional regulator [Labrys okinawensis]
MANGAKLKKAPRPAPDKFAARRAELAEAALQTLAELGYARTSLREIAQNSRFSHGVLHYYFSDKVDLIAYCVRDYKAKCVQRYERITADADSHGSLIDQFLDSLAATLRDEAPMHRLWYDLRSQALFEPSFHADVREIDKSLEDMVWRVMSRAFELAGVKPALPSAVVYATFDGLFEHALLRHLGGDADAIAQMQARIRAFLPACGLPAKMGTTGSRPKLASHRLVKGNDASAA